MFEKVKKAIKFGQLQKEVCEMKNELCDTILDGSLSYKEARVVFIQTNMELEWLSDEIAFKGSKEVFGPKIGKILYEKINGVGPYGLNAEWFN